MEGLWVCGGPSLLPTAALVEVLRVCRGPSLPAAALVEGLWGPSPLPAAALVEGLRVPPGQCRHLLVGVYFT